MISAKNQMISAAASDLGLGDMLKQQLDDTMEERRKKLLRQAQTTQLAHTQMGPATQSLFAGVGGYSV